MFGIKAYLAQKIKPYFDLWLEKRMPSAESHYLSQRNIFIFPTKFGFSYLLFVALLFVLGTNYQNNLILLLSYLLVSLFITCMLYSFSNIKGLTVSTSGHYIGFAEQALNIKLKLKSDKVRYRIKFSFQSQLPQESITVEGNQTLDVPIVCSNRGEYQPGRLTVESEYAMGLFRCWTHLKFELRVFICPKPVSCRYQSHYAAFDDNSQQQEMSLQGITGDDFYELKTYRSGDPLTQVAWKQVAKTGQWLTKSNQVLSQNPEILSLQTMPATNIETKLSQLCFLILQYEQLNRPYGIEISGVLIEPNTGKRHFEHCLIRLACYGY